MAMGTPRILIKFCAILAIAFLSLMTNCNDGDGLRGGDKEVTFRFGIWDDTTGVEDFVAVTEDEDIISSARDELLLPVSQRTLHIHGLIARGDGGHNLDWKWHFLPSKWVLVGSSIEVCDARPSAVEAWIESMPDTLESILYCPLSSFVKAENEMLEPPWKN